MSAAVGAALSAAVCARGLDGQRVCVAVSAAEWTDFNGVFMWDTFEECLDDLRAGSAWSSAEVLVLRDLWGCCISACAARVRSASRGCLPVSEVRPGPRVPYSLPVQTVVKRP
eukprot:4815078-Heterocapsa_arctica.AAC.1